LALRSPSKQPKEQGPKFNMMNGIPYFRYYLKFDKTLKALYKVHNTGTKTGPLLWLICAKRL